METRALEGRAPWAAEAAATVCERLARHVEALVWGGWPACRSCLKEGVVYVCAECMSAVSVSHESGGLSVPVANTKKFMCIN